MGVHTHHAARAETQAQAQFQAQPFQPHPQLFYAPAPLSLFSAQPPSSAAPPFPPLPPPVSSGGHTPGRDVYLCFGHDEEVGGGEGAARVAAELAARGMAFEFMLDEGLMIVDGGARQGGRGGRGWGGDGWEAWEAPGCARCRAVASHVCRGGAGVKGWGGVCPFGTIWLHLGRGGGG